MNNEDDDEVAESLRVIEDASKLLPGYCESVKANVPEFADELVARMKANMTLMRKVHSFLDWRSRNPLPRPRLLPSLQRKRLTDINSTEETDEP